MSVKLEKSPLFLPIKVEKRDGSQTAFDAAKIRTAVLQAGQATGELDESEASYSPPR